MKRTVLIVANSDPCVTGNVAEAVRIAAGLSTHQHLAVSLCFTAKAAEVLTLDADDLVDGDFYDQYLPILAENGKVLVCSQNPPSSSMAVSAIRQTELDQLTASSDRVLRF